MGFSPLETLPDDVDALQSLLVQREQRLVQQEQQLLKQDKRLHWLLAKVAKFEAERRLERARRFGASSEKGDLQACLFDEAEQQAEAAESEAADTTILMAAHRKRKPKRRPLPKDLPRVTLEHDLDDTTCASCGNELTHIGTKSCEQFGIIPAQCYVIEHVRHQYSCRGCNSPPTTAPLPRRPIPKSLASADLLAYTAVGKYVDGLPLYRQSAILKRMGVAIPRQTLARHMVKAGELVAPLIERLRAHALGYDILGMDETRVQVLKEPGKRAQSQSYMWVMRGGPPEQPIIHFHYDPGRDQGVPIKLLATFKGYLQRDGYAAYNAVARRDDITGVGCWAHVRRKYKDAIKAQTDPRAGRAHQAIAYIQKLYAIEKHIAKDPPSHKALIRQTQSKAVLAKFKDWLDRQSITPTSLLGKAINYTLNEWPHLQIYCEDGRLNIDNNPVENAIRPFAVGRRNWLFSDTQDGARSSANLYSLLETARANHLNPYAYLKWVFGEMPGVTTPQDIDALLPWNVQHDRLARMLVVPEVKKVDG